MSDLKPGIVPSSTLGDACSERPPYRSNLEVDLVPKNNSGVKHQSPWGPPLKRPEKSVGYVEGRASGLLRFWNLGNG